MTDYIFENEEQAVFHLCTPEQQAEISRAKYEGNERLHTMVGSEWGGSLDNTDVGIYRIYRVLAKPYTLEDAKQDICSEAALRKSNSNSLDPEHKVSAKFAMDIIDKLAKSLGGDK